MYYICVWLSIVISEKIVLRCFKIGHHLKSIWYILITCIIRYKVLRAMRNCNIISGGEIWQWVERELEKECAEIGWWDREKDEIRTIIEESWQSKTERRNQRLINRESKRETERQRERQTETETKRQREIDRDREDEKRVN